MLPKTLFSPLEVNITSFLISGSLMFASQGNILRDALHVEAWSFSLWSIWHKYQPFCPITSEDLESLTQQIGPASMYEASLSLSFFFFEKVTVSKRGVQLVLKFSVNHETN